MKQLLVPIISNEEVMPGTRLIWVGGANISATAHASQCVMARIEEVGR